MNLTKLNPQPIMYMIVSTCLRVAEVAYCKLSNDCVCKHNVYEQLWNNWALLIGLQVLVAMLFRVVHRGIVFLVFREHIPDVPKKVSSSIMAISLTVVNILTLVLRSYDQNRAFDVCTFLNQHCDSLDVALEQNKHRVDSYINNCWVDSVVTGGLFIFFFYSLFHDRYADWARRHVKVD